jgi:hypothetical protein
VPAIKVINQQSDDQPGEEAYPGNDFKPHHQHDAKDDAEYREERA